MIGEYEMGDRQFRVRAQHERAVVRGTDLGVMFNAAQKSLGLQLGKSGDHGDRLSAGGYFRSQSAIHNWLLPSGVRVEVHISLVPSGLKTGRMSAAL